MPRKSDIWTSRALPLYVAGAAVVVYVLQAIPFTGIFLMFVAAAYWPGFLLHLALVITFIYAVTGYIRRAHLLIPLVAYGGYYLAYANDLRLLDNQQAVLVRANSKQVLTFDPARMVLVGKNALRLVEIYTVPVAYEPSSDVKEGYYAWRIVPVAACRNTPRDTQNHIDVIYPWVQTHSDLCMLRMPEAPTLPKVVITRDGPELYDRPRDAGTFVLQKTSVSFRGRVMGAITFAAMDQLTALPWFVAGCFLNDGAASWDCVHQFQRSRVITDGTPAVPVFSGEHLPEVTLLGLRKYQDSDLANFKFWPGTEAAIAKAGTEAARVTDDVFAVLAGMLKNDNARPASLMDYSLGKDPARLSTFADAIADRLILLQDQKTQATLKVHPHLYEQFDALTRILAGMPPDGFASVAARIFALLQRDENAKNYPLLYLRTADLGPAALPQLKADLFANRFEFAEQLVPVLAFCRAGAADAATVVELKRRFAASDDTKSIYYEEALALTLIRLGEKDFVRANRAALKEGAQTWLDAVLVGKGEKDGRPNNCMSEEWPASGSLPDIMRPSLHRGPRDTRGDTWVERS